MKSYSSIWIHAIWTTKNRVPILEKGIRISLCKYIKQYATQNKYIIDTVNGVEDHLHCLVRLRPPQRLSDIIKKIKGSSSRWLNNRMELDFSWQTGYAAFSVNPNNLISVRKYIIKQENHHAEWGLEKELRKLKSYS